MIQYDANNDAHVLAIAIWAGKMLETDGFKEMFSKTNEPQNLSGVFREFAHPTVTFFSSDPAGIYHVLWYNQFLDAVCQGAWVREDKRNSTEVFKSWMSILRAYFKIVNTVLGFTKQKDILTTHIKLGYEVTGAVPDLFGENNPGWLVYLHKSKFKYLKPPVEKEYAETVPAG